MTKLLILDADAQAMKQALDAEFPQVEVVAAETHAQAVSHYDSAEVICALALPGMFSDAWIARAKRLKWIQALTSGADALLALRTLSRDVTITTARGIAGPQMSELIFLQMLGLSRDVRRIVRNQEQRVWERWPQPPLFGATVCIIGVGAIAEEFARRCQAFGMRVKGVSSTPRSVPHFDSIHLRADMATAVADADHVVVLLPYSAANRGAVDARVFAAMKRGAWFINFGRGGVVDEEALIAALNSGSIAGAALDVFATEPLPADHPLWTTRNVIITPHMGGSTTIYKDQVLPVIQANLHRYLNGDMAGMINRVSR